MVQTEVSSFERLAFQYVSLIFYRVLELEVYLQRFKISFRGYNIDLTTNIFCDLKGTSKLNLSVECKIIALIQVSLTQNIDMSLVLIKKVYSNNLRIQKRTLCRFGTRNFF